MKIQSMKAYSNILSNIVRALPGQPVPRAEVAAVVKKIIYLLVIATCCGRALFAQSETPNELQANLSSYIDNFGVRVVYPNFSLTRHVSEETSVSGRVLVDAVSAASSKSRFDVDGVTSATHRTSGGADNTPDELRLQLGSGITQNLGSSTAMLNLLYSTEHDYTSTTIAGNFSQPFAQKNTTIQIGFLRSFDKVFPQTRNWKRDLNVKTISLQATQNISPRMVLQAVYSYTENSGHLSDNYQIVRLPVDTDVLYIEPVHPNSRIRRAAAARINFRLLQKSSIQVGYRYYWDDWQVKSHTISTLFQTYITDESILGLGLRTHSQSKAWFFQESYSQREKYMTVDSKLNGAFTVDAQLKLTFPHISYNDLIPEIENLDYHVALNWYRRETDSPDWHSRLKTLYAYNLNLGVRYRF